MTSFFPAYGGQMTAMDLKKMEREGYKLFKIHISKLSSLTTSTKVRDSFQPILSQENPNWFVWEAIVIPDKETKSKSMEFGFVTVSHLAAREYLLQLNNNVQIDGKWIRIAPGHSVPRNRSFGSGIHTKQRIASGISDIKRTTNCQNIKPCDLDEVEEITDELQHGRSKVFVTEATHRAWCDQVDRFKKNPRAVLTRNYHSERSPAANDYAYGDTPRLPDNCFTRDQTLGNAMEPPHTPHTPHTPDNHHSRSLMSNNSSGTKNYPHKPKLYPRNYNFNDNYGHGTNQVSRQFHSQRQSYNRRSGFDSSNSSDDVFKTPNYRSYDRYGHQNGQFGRYMGRNDGTMRCRGQNKRRPRYELKKHGSFAKKLNFDETCSSPEPKVSVPNTVLPESDRNKVNLINNYQKRIQMPETPTSDESSVGSKHTTSTNSEISEHSQPSDGCDSENERNNGYYGRNSYSNSNDSYNKHEPRSYYDSYGSRSGGSGRNYGQSDENQPKHAAHDRIYKNCKNYNYNNRNRNGNCRNRQYNSSMSCADARLKEYVSSMSCMSDMSGMTGVSAINGMDGMNAVNGLQKGFQIPPQHKAVVVQTEFGARARAHGFNNGLGTAASVGSAEKSGSNGSRNSDTIKFRVNVWDGVELDVKYGKKNPLVDSCLVGPVNVYWSEACTGAVSPRGSCSAPSTRSSLTWSDSTGTVNSVNSVNSMNSMNGSIFGGFGSVGLGFGHGLPVGSIDTFANGFRMDSNGFYPAMDVSIPEVFGLCDNVAKEYNYGQLNVENNIFLKLDDAQLCLFDYEIHSLMMKWQQCV